MTETQAEKMIPNAVGRLDPVIDAIRAEDWIWAEDLCRAELFRRGQQISALEVELSNKQFDSRQIRDFIVRMSNSKSREKILAEACR